MGWEKHYVGEAIADWIRPGAGLQFYDARMLHELRPLGVIYDDDQLRYEGLSVTVPRYTPAELIRHPRITPTFIDDSAKQYVLLYEVAEALHRLLWPVATPPSTYMVDIEKGFEADVASIERRVAWRAWEAA